MKLSPFAIVVTMILAGCATTAYQAPPRPVEHWVEREKTTGEGRVDVSDAEYVVISSKSARVAGRVFCQQKIDAYSEEINSGGRRNHRFEWRNVTASQISLKSIFGSFTTSLDNEGRFEYVLSISGYDNMFFQAPDNLQTGFTLSKDLLTVDIRPIQVSGSVVFPSVNLTRVPVFILERSVIKEPVFDLDEAVRHVGRLICAKVVLKFENMRSRLPENPLITVIGISGPTKEDLIRTCTNLGYTRAQAVSIIAELDYVAPDQEVSDSGQMMVFRGIKNATYAIEARSAGVHFTRLDLVVEDRPVMNKTVLLSPDRSQMFFEDTMIKGGR
jgi:hypothetical protein